MTDLTSEYKVAQAQATAILPGAAAYNVWLTLDLEL